MEEWLLLKDPRVSRSSALASKATGFPIAKIAAKLAIGYTLNELQNDITGTTPASFEPSIDYVVTKIPRFTFEKFPGTSSELGSSMKSVGEVMSIGRSFHESLQKALTSLDIGLSGLNEVDMPKDRLGMINILSKQNPQRILQIAQAIRNGMELSHINEITKIDMWFLERINEIIKVENYIKKNKLPNDKDELFYIKSLGFTDERLSMLSSLKVEDIYNLRKSKNIQATFKRVDTCAGEFRSNTSYMYSTYGPNEKKKIIVSQSK